VIAGVEHIAGANAMLYKLSGYLHLSAVKFGRMNKITAKPDANQKTSMRIILNSQ
jgi:hypothetical protein